MHWLLYPLALLVALAGAGLLTLASTALHEIQAFVLLLTAAVLVGSAAIVQAVHRLRRAVLEQAPAQHHPQG